MNRQHTPVLIVGAGLAGTSTALFLAHHGVRATLVDRHPSTSNQPKARGQQPTVMEALDAVGLTQAILAATPPGRPEMTITICESVTGRVMHSFSEQFPDYAALSPAPMGMASQQSAEAVLAARAAELGADLRFGTRLDTFTQTADGVRAELTDLTTGERYELTADHLVGADGHRGTIAGALGIGTRSRNTFGSQTTVLFAADLVDRVPDTAVLMYYLQNPALPGGSGAFVSTDVPGEYVAAMSADPDRTDQQVVDVIRTIVGIADLPVRVLGANTWEIGHRVVDRMSEGRVHLVGDAAHLMPPTGGQGGNTAMLDGVHLAWKLAAVVNGAAGPGLLRGHSAEQLPLVTRVADWQYANMIERQRPDLVDDTLPPPVDAAALLFGYAMPTGAFVAEDGAAGLFEDPYAPSGRPGTRAPHVALARDGVTVSTRELFFDGFVLLSGDEEWTAAAAKVAEGLGVRIDGHLIGGELLDPEGGFARRYGLSGGGAVLVRPDGVIGWRSTGAADAGQLDAALRTILDR
ncbi:MAG: FAD-dependent monooxygenase [Actinocatenispora sp.]